MNRIRIAASLFVLSLATACAGDSTQPTSVIGAWNLSTLGGAPLPYLIQSANSKLELLSDQLVFSSAGRFTETGTLRVTESNGTVSTEPSDDAGRYTLNGTALTLVFDSDGSTNAATVSGNTFVVVSGGLTGVYTKQ